jgi:hypothetical protein
VETAAELSARVNLQAAADVARANKA